MSLTVTLLILSAYLIGSIPFALLMARRWGVRELRRIGSGNIGAANVLRASGVKAGVLVAVLDIAKGAAGVMLAQGFTAAPAAPAVAGVAAIVGHVYPVWLRFRGGKGVATACGVFAVLTPLAVPPALALFTLVIWITRYISMGSVAASIALPPIAYALGGSAAAVMAALAASTLIIFRHRSNLRRVRAGTEQRIGLRLAAAGAWPATRRGAGPE
jgi:glycerol-3-phosphate acyltransferase PlsY